jgi:hypothetical protein
MPINSNGRTIPLRNMGYELFAIPQLITFHNLCSAQGKMLEASLENTTQTMTCPSEISKDLRAIINAMLAIIGLRFLFTLWTSHVSHHHGLVRFQVSDRKLVKHTTEMIL